MYRFNRSCLIFLIFSQDQLIFKEKLLIKGLVHWLIVIVILTLVDCNCPFVLASKQEKNAQKRFAFPSVSKAHTNKFNIC
jgi:hypothetical protein